MIIECGRVTSFNNECERNRFTRNVMNSINSCQFGFCSPFWVSSLHWAMRTPWPMNKKYEQRMQSKMKTLLSTFRVICAQCTVRSFHYDKTPESILSDVSRAKSRNKSFALLSPIACRPFSLLFVFHLIELDFPRVDVFNLLANTSLSAVVRTRWSRPYNYRLSQWYSCAWLRSVAAHRVVQKIFINKRCFVEMRRYAWLSSHKEPPQNRDSCGSGRGDFYAIRDELGRVTLDSQTDAARRRNWATVALRPLWEEAFNILPVAQHQKLCQRRQIDKSPNWQRQIFVFACMCVCVRCARAGSGNKFTKKILWNQSARHQISARVMRKTSASGQNELNRPDVGKSQQNVKSLKM